MSNLHAVIAAEPTVKKAYTDILASTKDKFATKAQFFEGQLKTLKMLEDSPQNLATEEAARAETALRGGVAKEMKFLLDFFVKNEKLQVQKNCTNAAAKASIIIDGVVYDNIPLHEFLGLKDRAEALRALVVESPTLDASKPWTWDFNQAVWMAPPETTIKSEKELYAVTLAPATDKHPAQVKENSRDKTVGKFVVNRKSLALTATQKSNALEFLDEIIAAIDTARTIANSTEVIEVPNPAEGIATGLLKRLTDRSED